MTSRSQSSAGLHSVPGNGGASPVNFNAIVSSFAASQLIAATTKAEKCPGYCCTETLGPDSGIIDGTEYCADCVANEAWEAGREERKINAELFARFGGDA